MKITQLRTILDKESIKEPGVSVTDKQETYPTTPTLLKKLKVDPAYIFAVSKQQHKVLDTLPEFESLKNLRDYQLEDVKFLAARKAAGCFNEQRTGKTPTALSVMKVKAVTKLLIIAPASTLYTWAEECHKWWFTELPATVVDGTASNRKQIIDNWKEGALIISYECLRSTTHATYNEQGEIQELKITGDIGYISKHKDIGGVILDEAHRIKNRKSKQAEALFSLSKVPNKLALTGTPAPGKQHEIFPILHWLYPSLFKGYWRFIDYYFYSEKGYGAQDYTAIGTCRRGKDVELQEFLDVISTRRLRSSVMPWLPEKDRQTIKLPLNAQQTKYINDLDKYFEIEGTDVNASNILTRLLRVRQLCLAPAILELPGNSPKLNWIKQYLKDYPDKKVLIFSNFTSWLKLLSEELKCDNLIIGETTKTRREELKNQFQDGKINLLLINIKAGKEGITLDSADVAIFTDKYPPVGDILQAEDRLVATTKDKLNTGHTIIDLVMKDTYEENIAELLAQNASEVDIINNFKKYLKGGD